MVPNLYMYLKRYLMLVPNTYVSGMIGMNSARYVDVFGTLSKAACLRVFAGDIYGDHTVSCASIIGIKHCHNLVRDTLVDICLCLGISADHDVCMDLTGSSPLKQSGMADFMLGRAVIDDTQRKRIKYMAKCVAIGNGRLPFSISSLGISFANAKGVGAQIVSQLPSNLL
ncbi:hypothetical protein Tco_0578132 [Tanacetum coccineum]